ncbi:uncharacterized protein LOC112595752 [Melanaphis sacchari]|uniref:uncharacterized protein LOC112595752 n=1 Tax=Melanaphis sacchari TaxID=742174 RepID=UPI000DC140E1|nr:uncharacterized protein LOC112595752 [Melanaphis sacchari]XP_025196838.1 uncharacterized protein LOC112595752 [Melanaphis sacchari]XP_025196839.1 uncharacterized protein LOC112595752 [Melanaphis sacchari]XP_025196840.1 uncharacterized protein LOC112595752 [Melanaphis sacchari]
MNSLGTEVTGRRSLFNGLMTAATRSWRHGLQPNRHNSNAVVFPTIFTSINNNQNYRTSATNHITEDQRRRDQQQQQEHSLNLLWYGGEEMQRPQPTSSVLFELHNRYQSPDDWEKQPLRQRRHKSQYQQNYKKRSALPTSPIVWAFILHIIYSAAMAAVYYIYDIKYGSGWIWLRGIDNSNIFKWLCRLQPMWYFSGQAFCAVIISYIWYQWQKRQRWCCYMLIVLFITALLPSVPLAEVFGDKGMNKMTEDSSENSAERRKQLLLQLNYYNSEDIYENQLALYEGLWQMSFFIFVSYCLVFPTSIDEQSRKELSEIINEHNDNKKNIKDNFKEDPSISIAVLLFAIVTSIGHTILSMYIAYQQHQRLVNNSSMAAIQQLTANVVVLACVNLAGWLLRQSIIEDRTEIRSHEGNNIFSGKHEYFRLALRRQANKLNQLLTSLLPRRIFLEMKYNIVADAAHSLNTISQQDNAQLQSHQQEILQRTNFMPKMFLKEYENVSVVFANVTGFWDNAPLIVSNNNSGSQISTELITLIDQLLANLFRKLAYRNRCLPIRLLGHRMYFIAGLPDEESFRYDDDEQKNASWLINDNGHARNAIQMGLDLIEAVNTVVRDVSRCHNIPKINLNVRVGVHSGRVACGVLGFTGNASIRSDSGSRWQYSAWGRDVQVASYVENSGSPGLVHVSHATVNQVTKKGVVNTAVNRVDPLPSGVNLRNNTINYQGDTNDYTFERSYEEQRNHFLCDNRIETYYVKPKTAYSHPEKKENLMDDNSIYDVSREVIVPLILQSIEQLLLREEMRQKYPEMESEQQPTNSSTSATEIPVMLAALVPIASLIKRNRHRRSKYFEQDSQAVSTNLNTTSAINSSMDRYGRWENDVFVVSNKDDYDKVKNKFNDDDLFRLAKSELLLLCVIITLFVVNVTTMPWTMLLCITFITPFVITAGELIYVMALLIGWIPRPKFYSTTYATAIIADDDEYYHHYDSDNNDSDASSSSNSDDKCFKRFFVCHASRYSLFAWLLKPFQCRTDTVMTTRNHLDNSDGWRKCSFKWCRCYGIRSWFTCCSNNEGASSCISSDDSDVESRPGYRNENAIMAATARASSLQQQNRFQHSQPININNSYNNNLLRRRHRQLKRIYQDEERRTYFYWICACCELIVILLICLLALLNAFTCEPVETKLVYNQLHTQNIIMNGSGGFNTPKVNLTQQYRSPLTCMWPQYAVLTCCLVFTSIAIAFPIYYGSLPTLRMKIIILFVMTCVFSVAFVHFTHKHVFMAASMSSPTQSLFSRSIVSQDHRTNNTVTKNNNDHHEIINALGYSDSYQENQQLLKLRDREQQKVTGLNTAMATVYAITFAMATLACFVYKHRLQDRRAHHRVKVDRNVRRLCVLREAHRRTLHAVIPDHVTNLLRKRCINDPNDADDEFEGTRRQQNYVFGENRSIPIRTTPQIQEHIPANLSQPLYHCSYRAIVVIFATILQQEQSMPNNINVNSDTSGHLCHAQLALLYNIFSEFDRLIDNQKYRGLVEKIKMLGTNTYMAAVGLQHHDGTKRRQVMLLNDTKQKRDESCNFDHQERKNDVENASVSSEDKIELYNVISANNVTFALDFIQEMHHILHRRQTTTPTINGNSQFVLRVGVDIGPAVAGLIGCNDGIWKRPQFDIWGNTVNVARQMDITGIPGKTQVTNCVYDVMSNIECSKYKFDIHTNIINKYKIRKTYLVRESFEQDDGHNLGQQKLSNYHDAQLRQNSLYQYESEQSHQLNKKPAPIKQSQHIHRSTPRHLPRHQPPFNKVSIGNIHSKHSHYNSMVQPELRQKCLELQKTPPPPPPRSPPPVTTRRTQCPMQHKYSEECDRYPDIQQRSRGAPKQEQYQQNRCTSNSTSSTAATYARPLQKQQQQNSQQSISVSVPPHGLVRIFGDDSGQLSPSHTPITTESKPTCTSSNHTTGGTTLNTTLHNHLQSQQIRRPNVLLLKNTTSVSTNKFDANRPLPDPPRSSDTVAGRHRNRDDPRRRRRRQHNQPPTITKQRQDINNDQCSGVVSPAWPSSSSFRSPISVGSFISESSPPSSLSSSGSTDAGGTTTSNNNYNTTTSSSDDSFGCTTTEDGGGIDRIDTEDLDTAVSSVAISSVHHRYRQQQHLLLHQWSPTTTANSSPVRRSSSFRSPLSAGDNTAASSSSLRSPPIIGNPATACIGGTQSLNRRHVRPANTTPGAGSSSSRRRRRRQQQQNLVIAGNSTPPSGDKLDVIGVMNTTSNVSTEKYESPSSSPWKKQQQRRQILNKDQGTGGGVVGPDFTDEIRRILLLDHHRGNVRQQQRSPFKEEKVQVNKHSDDYNKCKDKVNDNVAKHLSSSEQLRLCAATVVTTDRKPGKDDKNSQQIEEDIVKLTAIEVPTTIASTTVIATSVSSASLFEERERQITEQVKRQQAEVRRILQEHKNNVVAVVRGPTTVTTDAISHSRKQRSMALTVESSWSDDESLEPSLLDNKHRPQSIGFAVDISDHEVNSNIVTAEAEYTTGGDGDDYTTDGDGYTTTGYTTDEAAAPVGRQTDMSYATTGGLPGASTARQLDDNLSTMNDTGLTDAEAALSDVNSMIDYNDCNDNSRYRGRRQSSLSSNSLCPYASDSFCEDDDDYNDDGQYFFWDGNHVQNENVELGDDGDDNDSRYNHNHILLQQQLSLTHPTSLLSQADDLTGIDKKRFYCQQQLQQSTTLQANDSNTTMNITPKQESDASTAATTTISTSTQNPTSISSNTNINASPNYCTTATNTSSTNTELHEPPSSDKS